MSEIAYKSIFSYLTIKLFVVIVNVILFYNKGQNLDNLHNRLDPYIIHPFLKIFQMAMVIIIVILSIDRYVVVFYPYVIYRNLGKCEYLKQVENRHFSDGEGTLES